MLIISVVVSLQTNLDLGFMGRQDVALGSNGELIVKEFGLDNRTVHKFHVQPGRTYQKVWTVDMPDDSVSIGAGYERMALSATGEIFIQVTEDFRTYVYSADFTELMYDIKHLGCLRQCLPPSRRVYVEMTANSSYELVVVEADKTEKRLQSLSPKCKWSRSISMCVNDHGMTAVTTHLRTLDIFSKQHGKITRYLYCAFILLISKTAYCTPYVCNHQ